MKRVIVATLLLAWPLAASADEVETSAALPKIQTFVATARAEAERVIASERAAAKARLAVLIDKEVVIPSVDFALNNSIPGGDDAVRLVHAEVDRRLAAGSGGIGARVASFAGALDALLAKGHVAVAKVRAERARRAAALAAFDPKVVLDVLRAEATRRAEGLARGRISAHLDEAIAVLLAPMSSEVAKLDAGLDKVPGLRALFSGFAGDLVYAAGRALRAEARELAVGAVKGRVADLLGRIFAAARGAGSAPARDKPNVERLRRYLQEARDRVSIAERHERDLQMRLTELEGMMIPKIVSAAVRAKEEAQLLKAVVAEVRADPAAAKRPEVAALVAAEKRLADAQANADKAVRAAAAAAVKSCGGQGAACIAARVAAAEKRESARVAATQAQSSAKTAKLLARVDVATEVAKSFTPPTAPQAPTRSPFNAAPPKLEAAAAKEATAAEKAAETDIPKAALPKQLPPPRTTAQVLAKFRGAAKDVVTKAPARHLATILPPVVSARTGSAGRGARMALAVAHSIAKQDWKRALVAAKALRPKANALVRTKRHRAALAAALDLLQSGAHLMLVGASRARVVQLKRFFGLVTPALTRALNDALRRPPSYLQGLFARVRGPVASALRVASHALIRLAITGQRLVLSSRVFVERTRWKLARRSMLEFFAGLARTKRGLRLLVKVVRQASARRVALARPRDTDG